MKTELKPILKSMGASLSVLAACALFIWAEVWVINHLTAKTLFTLLLSAAFVAISWAFYACKFRSETR